MTRSKFKRPLVILAAVECLVLFAAFFGSLMIKTGSVSLTDPWLMLVRLLSLCAVVELMMFAVGLFSWRFATGYSDLFVRIVAAFILGFAGYAVLVYAIDSLTLPATLLALTVGLAIPAVFAVRLAFMRLTDLAQTKGRIIVLGTSKQAAQLARLEKGGPASRFRIAAFVELEGNSPAVDDARIVPMPNDLGSFALEEGASQIVVALEERRGRVPLAQLIRARVNGIEVTEYQTFCEMVQGRIDLDALRPSWFFQSDGFRTSRVQSVIKRAMDIGLSLFVLTFTLPLLVFTAIAIKIDSPGPIFYRQERIGRGGRPFVLIKFRSMRANAEAGNSPRWASESDPRATRVGAVIRQARIDEIPQIINVLKGDMSFVGPRPERTYFVDRLASELPYYQERHSVRPGITGWAQLNYPYGASIEDAKQKLQYDLFYIKYFSIIFDLSIALQTVRVILWPEGAR